MMSTGPNPSPNPASTATATATTTISVSAFDKYKTYVSYDTKEKNSTIGHDEILKKIKQEQEKYDKEANTNNNNVEGAAIIKKGISFVDGVNDSSESNNNGSSYGTGLPRNMSPSNLSIKSIVSDDSYSENTIVHFKQSVVDELRISKEEIENELEDIVMEEMAAKGMLLHQLDSYRERDRLPLSEDVYAFIVACPVWSAPFWFATYFILVKYIIYGILLSDISNDDEYINKEPLVQVVKFFLIPVAVTMQDDLMTVYANVANKKYDAAVMRPSKHATQTKVIVANVARLLDGLLSLGVNFGVMLMTNTILNVFLNFAALHFLQYIDNIFYELVEKGFFGDRMEYATTLCKKISFPRRVAQDNSTDEIEYTDTERGRNSKPTNQSCDSFLISMDSILMCSTGLVCIIIYGIVQGCIYRDYPDGVWPVDIPGSNFADDSLLEDIEYNGLE